MAKKTKRKKKVIAAVAFGLVVALGIVYVGSSIGAHSWNPAEWFTPRGEISRPSDDNGGAIITDGENNGISLLSARIAPEEYGDYGISAQAENAFTITAVVEPEGSYNTAVDYSIAWLDADSEWATGKSVDDYYAIAQTSDGSLNATATCKQAFAEPVIITCTLRESQFPVSATLRAEYVAKVTGLSLNIPAYYVEYGGTYNATYSPVWSIGTITGGGTVTIKSVTVNFSSAFISAMQAIVSATADDSAIACRISGRHAFTADSLVPEDNEEERLTFKWSDFISLKSGKSIDSLSTENFIRLQNEIYNCLYGSFTSMPGGTICEKGATWAIGYSYTIDGVTNTGTTTYVTDINCKIARTATGLSFGQTVLKH